PRHEGHGALRRAHVLPPAKLGRRLRRGALGHAGECREARDRSDEAGSGSGREEGRAPQDVSLASACGGSRRPRSGCMHFGPCLALGVPRRHVLTSGHAGMGGTNMAKFTWDHIHLRTPDPEATALWFEKMLGAEITRTT